MSPERREALEVAIVDGGFPSRGPEAWEIAGRIADALAPHLAAWSEQDRAEALREAADELPRFLDIVRRDDVRKWLLDRAALTGGDDA